MKKFLKYFLFILLFFGVLNISFATDYSKTWDFDSSSDYTTSNSNVIVPGNSKVQLKEIINVKGNISSLTNANAVVVSGNYAYVGTYNGANSQISIIDITDSSNPIVVYTIKHNTAMTGGTPDMRDITDLLIDGDYLYATTYTSETFSIFNISNPTAPSFLISFPSTTFDAASGMAKFGDYIYVAGRLYDGITVIDVSDPATPTIVGTITNGSVSGNALDGPWDLKIRQKENGTYLFATNGYRRGLITINITNCLSGSQTCTMSLENYLTFGLTASTNTIKGIEIDKTGNYAFVAANGNNRLYIVDITDPSNPTNLTYITTSGDLNTNGIWDIFVDGDKLYYTASSGNSVGILDITNPLNPVHINKITTGTDGALLNTPRSLFKKDNKLFVASYGSNAFQILEISYDNSSPYIIPNINFTYTDSLGAIYDLYGKENEGSIKFQLSNDGGATWHYFNGSSWVQTTSGVENSNTVFEINNNMKYLRNIFQNGNYKFKMFLISDGNQKVEVDSISILGKLPSEVVQDFNNPNNYYYSDQSKFFFNGKGEVELRQKLLPIGNILETTNLRNISNVVVDGNYAYVVTNQTTSSKLSIIDISEPETPIIKKVISHGTVMGQYTVSLNNPAIGSATSNDNIGKMIKDGDYLYVMGYTGRSLNIFNVSDPENPTLVYQTATPANSSAGYLRYASGIQKKGNYIYVTGEYYDGVSLYDVSDPSKPIFKSTINGSTNYNGVSDLRVVGDYIYLTSHWDLNNNFVIVDASDVSDLKFVSKLGDSSMYGFRNFVINGNYAYVSQGRLGNITIIDISNHSSPSVVKTVDATIDSNINIGDTRDIVFDKDTLYVSSYSNDSIFLIDVSNPLNPKFINKVINNNYDIRLDGALGIKKVGKYLYIASYDSRALQILKESYDTNSPYLYPKSPIYYLPNEYIVSSFSAPSGLYNEGVLSFQISKDNGETWYYFNGTKWTKATQSTLLQSNSASIINDNIFDFNFDVPGGTGELLFKAFFTSNGEQVTSLENVVFGFTELDLEEPELTINSPINGESYNEGTNINVNINYTDYWSGVDISTLSGALLKWNGTSWGTTNILPTYLTGASITGTGMTGVLSALPVGVYGFSYSISDLYENVTESVVYFEVNSSDSNPPEITSYFPTEDLIVPSGTFSIDIGYEDDVGIDISKVYLVLQKWNGENWGNDISSSAVVSSNITSSGATYNLSGLSYGKYMYGIIVFDTNGNSESEAVEFYIDEPKIIINNSLYESSINITPDTEIIITVETIGAPYKLELYKDSDFINQFGDVIIDWNGTTGVGYDHTIYSGVLKNIPSYPIFATKNKDINTSGELNIYEHRVKIWSLVEELQAPGKYEMNISIKGFFSY